MHSRFAMFVAALLIAGPAIAGEVNGSRAIPRTIFRTAFRYAVSRGWTTSRTDRRVGRLGGLRITEPTCQSSGLIRVTSNRAIRAGATVTPTRSATQARGP